MTSLFPLFQQQLLECSNPPLFPGDLSGEGTAYWLRPCVCTGTLGWRRRWDEADYIAAIFVDTLVAFTAPRHAETWTFSSWKPPNVHFEEGQHWTLGNVEVKYERAACRLWLQFGPWVATLAHIHKTAGLRVPNHTGLGRRQKMGFSIRSGAKVVLRSMCWVCSVAAPLQSISWPSSRIPATQSIVTSSQGLFSECHLKSAYVQPGIFRTHSTTHRPDSQLRL